MNDLEKEQYWMVTGSWFEIFGNPSSIITRNSPEPVPPTIIPKTKTEFIAMHPAKYCILMQQERPMYALLLTQPITRQTFETIIGLAQIANNGHRESGAESKESDGIKNG